MTKRNSRNRNHRRTQVEPPNPSPRSQPGGPNPEAETSDLLELGSDEGQELLEFEGPRQEALIKVLGVGGGGGNALNNMIRQGLAGVEFIAANTDAQALHHNQASNKIQLGSEVTRGLGCGANPEKGRESAMEVRDRIRELLEGTDMVFVTAGMGGGTGTGAAPVIAEVAREVGALTVGVVTKPFSFEGRVRGRHCDRGIEDLHQVVDTLITIPNQRLLALAGKQTGIKEAFSLADEVLLNAVRGISDLITIHGLINLDFADVRTVMNEAGVAMMGTGAGRGDGRASEAARAAISSPLLEDLSIEGARGVLINITGGDDMTLFEVNEASTLVQEAAHEEANIIFGAVVDDELEEGEVRVTVIATGLEDGHQTRRPRRPAPLGDDIGPNVHPLHREPGAPAPAPVAGPIVESQPVPVQAQAHAHAPLRETQPPAHSAAPSEMERERERDRERPRPRRESVDVGFDSPFVEDEFDVPTFIRRRESDADEDDPENPAFLRRAQD